MSDGERPMPYWLRCLAGEVKQDAIPHLYEPKKKKDQPKCDDGFSVLPIVLLLLAGLMLLD